MAEVKLMDCPECRDPIYQKTGEPKTPCEYCGYDQHMNFKEILLHRLEKESSTATGRLEQTDKKIEILVDVIFQMSERIRFLEEKNNGKP